MTLYRRVIVPELDLVQMAGLNFGQKNRLRIGGVGVRLGLGAGDNNPNPNLGLVPNGFGTGFVALLVSS